MTDVSLATIVDATRARVAATRRQRRALEAAASVAPPAPAWADPLRVAGDVSVVAEVKRRSPSAGDIAPALDPADLARAYLAGGARAISVLTEPSFFGGSPEDLMAARDATSLPILRKDFVIDPVQLYETRVLGASCALLIVRILDDVLLAELSALATELGLARLVEVHTMVELERALPLAPESIGVNSRDLDTFAVDVAGTEPILRAIPDGVVAVAESGIATRDEVERVATWGADAILVGTALAVQAQPAATVATLTGIRRRHRDAPVTTEPGGEQ